MRIFWRDPYFLYYWLPPILWGLAIIAMSGDFASSRNTFGLLRWLLSWFMVPTPALITKLNIILRKCGHATAYGLMYFLWFRALRGHLEISPGRAFLYAVGLCLLVSVTDEGHQSFTRFRGSSGYDVLLDLTGACLAAIITQLVWAPRPKTGAVPESDAGESLGPG